MLNAGHAEATVAAIVGHAVQSMTAGRYYAGPSDDLLRAAVESIRIPPMGDRGKPPPGGPDCGRAVGTHRGMG